MVTSKSRTADAPSTTKSVVVTRPYVITEDPARAVRKPLAKAPGVSELSRAASAQLGELARLGRLVDDLATMRDLLRKSQVAERELTAELIEAMRAVGVDELPGTQALATLGSRTTIVPDVALFIEAAGGLEQAVSALAVKVEPARQLVAGDTLRAISDETVSDVLYIRPAKAGAR